MTSSPQRLVNAKVPPVLEHAESAFQPRPLEVRPKRSRRKSRAERIAVTVVTSRAGKRVSVTLSPSMARLLAGDMRPGRPSKLDVRTWGRLIGAAWLGASQREMARAAEVRAATLTDWLKRGRAGDEPFATFVAEIARARAVATLRKRQPSGPTLRLRTTASKFSIDAAPEHTGDTP